ncbi:MAG: hypothetical protein F6J95_001505 [Leptolyngbya sp. SIO1E4]|nr:hypothetical protein [Leptolyngbya sp. SIO1E4]
MSFPSSSMRILHPDIWNPLSNWAYSSRLTQVFWLSFWLMVGLNILGQSTAAATTKPQPKTAELTMPLSAPTPEISSATEDLQLANAVGTDSTIAREDIAASSAAEWGQSFGDFTVPVERASLPKASGVKLGSADSVGIAFTAFSEAANELTGAMFEPEAAVIAQASETGTDEAEAPTEEPQPTAVEPLQTYQPLLEFQAVSIFQDDDFSGRLRATGIYAISEQVLFGATVDLATGEGLVDSREEGLSLNELYVSAAPIQNLPNLRVVAGLIDFTSYFDRNSFAKDGATQFFNPVFQTNPALSATGIASRPGLLVNWSATDQLELKAAAFSSSRELGDLALDGFAAEVGFRVENLIVRGTYATARDAGSDDGFSEIFQFGRGDGRFGPLDDDREVAYGFNAEYFIESLNLGLFGRYGWYENQDLDRGGSTFSLGLNALELFTEGDRLGLAYGQQLSNSDLRTGKTPDVWELFYDAPITDGVRAGVSLQSRDELSDTIFGVRLRADW